MDEPKKLGWFHTPDRLGDRTIEMQMEGLERLVAEVAGKTVLDVGCAEGLISIELAKAGAKSCLGLEIVPGHVDVANFMAEEMPCEFRQFNLNEDDLSGFDKVDVVLMLAVLHKLRKPDKVCAQLATLAKDLCVIRLPPSGLVIVDPRSESRPQDIGKVMDKAGFDLEWQGCAPMDEYISYWRRRGQVKKEPIVSREAFEQTEPGIFTTKRRRARSVEPEAAASPAEVEGE